MSKQALAHLREDDKLGQVMYLESGYQTGLKMTVSPDHDEHPFDAALKAAFLPGIAQMLNNSTSLMKIVKGR